MLQTAQEFQILQGAMIDAQFVQRGKIVSARKLRNDAKKLDSVFVDYRMLGYVTEVKDQVRYFEFPDECLYSRLNHDHLCLHDVCRVIAVLVGPSALQELLRDKCTRRRVSLYL